MLFLIKLLIVAGTVFILRSSASFREMSRELDEVAFMSIRKIMRAVEESGYPGEAFILLIVLTAVFFAMALAATTPSVP